MRGDPRGHQPGSRPAREHGRERRAALAFDKLARATRVAVRQLHASIDFNDYPIPETHASNSRWRPVGLR
ncbi:MAG TPA: hypothetical protein VMF89_16230 [Polyangiales bacterium]|nr:hypothetical protein [Polyangiales bacterium]